MIRGLLDIIFVFLEQNKISDQDLVGLDPNQYIRIEYVANKRKKNSLLEIFFIIKRLSTLFYILPKNE
jgi:hypothetical protein